MNAHPSEASAHAMALLLRPLKTFRSGFVALGIIVLLATAGVVAWPAATSCSATSL